MVKKKRKYKVQGILTRHDILNKAIIALFSHTITQSTIALASAPFDRSDFQLGLDDDKILSAYDNQNSCY